LELFLVKKKEWSYKWPSSSEEALMEQRERAPRWRDEKQTESEDERTTRWSGESPSLVLDNWRNLALTYVMNDDMS
jgi:hypothetical protein